MKQIFKIQMLFCCLLLALLSCHSSDQNVPENPVPDQEAAVITKYDVSIAAMKFQPDTLVVNKGDTIVFTNNDMVAHDVTDFPSKSWTSSELKPGASWSYIVTKTGNYFCSIHQVMKGRIIVK